ncbi:hypothetical protein HG531_013801 [Fusarium graminearum]|nr:hypothetical protein HG531_013801 [Fusarium graminearum]
MHSTHISHPTPSLAYYARSFWYPRQARRRQTATAISTADPVSAAWCAAHVLLIAQTAVATSHGDVMARAESRTVAVGADPHACPGTARGDQRCARKTALDRSELAADTSGDTGWSILTPWSALFARLGRVLTLTWSHCGIDIRPHQFRCEVSYKNSRVLLCQNLDSSHEGPHLRAVERPCSITITQPRLTGIHNSSHQPQEVESDDCLLVTQPLVRHVTEDRESKFLWWAVGLHNFKEYRDNAMDGGVLLSFFAETAEVKQGIKDLVRDFAEVRLALPHTVTKKIDQGLDGIS